MLNENVAQPEVKAVVTPEIKTEVLAKAEVKPETKPAPINKDNAPAKPKSKKAKVEAKAPDRVYPFRIKGPKSKPTVVMTVEGKEREFGLGNTEKFKFSQFNVAPEITDLFKGIAAKAGATPTGLTLSAKAAYKGAHFGWTRALNNNSWRGFITFTDGDLCFHDNAQAGVTKGQMLSAFNAAKINPNRSNANWFTLPVTKSTLPKIESICLGFIKAVSGQK